MRCEWLVVLICGCDRAEDERPVPLPPGPRDAAIDAAPDASIADAAPLEPSLSCDGKMLAMGHLEVRVDPTTLRGRIDRLTAGMARQRHLKVIARRAGETTTLIFDGFLPGDLTSSHGRTRPPPAEQLVRGTSIVARLVAVPPGTTRLYVEHDVDWVTDAHLVVQDGYTVCTPAGE